MKSANAFSYAISGSLSENQINSYSQFVSNTVSAFQGMGGWLGEQANKTLESMTEFVNSRAWEMGKRLGRKNEGEYVGSFEIGYLGSVSAIQQAQGLMCNIIMSVPEMQQRYVDGLSDGYGGNLSPWCTGIGDDNLFHRKINDGVLRLGVVDDKPFLHHTHYHDTVGGKYNFRERVDAQSTVRAVRHHLLSTEFDLASGKGDKWKTPDEAE